MIYHHTGSHMRILLRPGSRANLDDVRAELAARTKRRKLGQFDYPTQRVGHTVWTGTDGMPVTVWVDPSLGQPGADLAQWVLGQVDGVMRYMDSLFFPTQGQAGNVIIAALNGALNGSTGAYHYGCDFSSGGDWYEDYSAGNGSEVLGLVAAEICESYMGVQGRGWNCGGSGGEALSRVIAQSVSGGPAGALLPYASGPAYDGTDWISRDQGTDGDYPSIGCGVLYLYWMLSQGYTLAQIVQAGELDGTLASNWSALTGGEPSRAFASFAAALEAAGGPTSDDPFGSVAPPTPPPTPPPPTPAGSARLSLTSPLPAGDYLIIPAAPAGTARARMESPREGG